MRKFHHTHMLLDAQTQFKVDLLHHFDRTEDAVVGEL